MGRGGGADSTFDTEVGFRATVGVAAVPTAAAGAGVALGPGT